MERVLTWLQELIAAQGMRILTSILILIVGRLAAAGIRSLMRRNLEKRGVDETLVAFVTNVTYVAVLAFAIIAALGKLGVQTASFVAVIGSAGLAIGLALQGSLANFAAGLLMIVFRPFKIGDFVETNGTSGTVEEIGIFTTQLKTPDNKKVIVPNAKATSDNIVNFTAHDQRRIDIVVGVGYGDDLSRVRQVLESILAEDPRVLQEPAPTIGVLELGESSVNFVVRPWVNTTNYWDVFFDIQERIKACFDAEGISIPYPQQDVHIQQSN